MSNDTPPPSKTEPIESGYQEHPDSDKELINAIESVPIKDYSDYEITIEEKDTYEDALFSDEDSLDDALKSKNKIKEPSSTLPEKTESSEVSYQTTLINFKDFLTENSQTEKYVVPSEEKEHTPTHLNVVETGVNDSPVCDNIAYEDDINDQLDTDQKLPNKSSTEKILDPDEVNRDYETHSKEPKAFTFQQKLLIKAKKLRSKAKEKMDKSKVQFDEYAGISLPARELPLEFSHPPQKPKNEFEFIITQQTITQQFSIKRPLLSVLKKSSSDLTLISKCKLSHSNRKTLLDAFSAHLPEKIQSAISSYQRKPSVATDTKKRLEISAYAELSLKHLIGGYKQLYAEIYQAKNVLYGPQRKTANEISFLLFDLLTLEQQLSIAAHSSLPSGSIKTLNKLFHALLRYEEEFIENPCYAFSMGKKINIKSLFLRYQLCAALDFKTLSSREHKTLYQYIQHNLGLLKLQALDDNIPTETHWAITHDNAGAPLLKTNKGNIKNGKQAFSSAIIQTKRFFNHTKQDYEECLGLIGTHNAQHSSAALNSVNIHESLSVLSQLNASVLHIEKQQEFPSYSQYKPIAFTAYSGIVDCNKYLDFFYAKSTSTINNSPDNDLPTKPAASKSQWLCAAEDEDTLYLQTNENIVGIHLDTGSPLLLSNTTENEARESSEDLTLTVIIRLERGQKGIVHIIARKISRKTAPVTLTTPKVEGKPALLLLKNEKHYLLTTGEDNFWSGNLVHVIFPDKTKSTLCIDSLSMITKHIQLLKLS